MASADVHGHVAADDRGHDQQPHRGGRQVGHGSAGERGIQADQGKEKQGATQLDDLQVPGYKPAAGFFCHVDFT